MFSRVRHEWLQLGRLASPLLAAQIFTTGLGVVDTVIAGNYRALDLAAVALGSSIWLPVYMLICGLMIATTSMVARFHGAGQTQQLVTTAQQSVWLALMAAVLSMMLLLNVSPLLRWMQVQEDLILLTASYLQAVAAGLPGAAIFVSLRSFSEGMGRTKPFMISSFLAFLCNIPLNYALIYGRWGLPELGGEGCGWATAMSMWIQALVLIGFTRNSRYYEGVKLYQAWCLPHWATIASVARLGIPITLGVFAEVSIFSVIALMLAPLGTLAVASHQIALSSSHLIFMLPLSLSQALTIRVGYFLGQGDQRYANFVARCGIGLSGCLALMTMTLLLLFRGEIVGWYTDNPQVHALAAGLFVWMACYQFPDHIQIACNAVLRAYQDTRIPLILILFSYWGVALPLGYGTGLTDWLGIGPMAAAGFWMALVVGLTGTAFLLSGRLLWLARQPLAVPVSSSAGKTKPVPSL